MKISERLKEIASMVTTGNTVADIGTDHGYVPVYLCKNNISNHIIAMDINEGPLKIARQNIKGAELEDKVDIRQSAGFENIKPGEADTAIIAGMGGELIVRILSEHPEVVSKLKELILSPQSEINNVREYLSGTCHMIVNEKMILEDGKFYTIIKTENSGCGTKYSELEYNFGPVLIRKREPVFMDYLNMRLDKAEKILENIKSANSDPDRITEIEKEITEINKILNG